MSTKTLTLWHLQSRTARPAAPVLPSPVRLLDLLARLAAALRRFLDADPVLPAVAFRNRRG